MNWMDQKQFAIVECDHFTEQARVHDRARKLSLHSQGIRVLHFTEEQIELETKWGLSQMYQAQGSTS